MPYVNLREWEVRAYLEGRLSRLVRPVKPQPVLNLDNQEDFSRVGPRTAHLGYFSGSTPYRWDRKSGCPDRIRCPLGKPGEVIVGREAWLHIDDEGDKFDGMGSQTYYRADQSERSEEFARKHGLRWRSAATMPLRFARIRLVVESVTVKLARDVTEEEALEMGHQPLDNEPGAEDYDGSYRAAFAYCLTRDFGPATYDGWVWLVRVRRENG